MWSGPFFVEHREALMSEVSRLNATLWSREFARIFAHEASPKVTVMSADERR